jgi:hypothetical protein
MPDSRFLPPQSASAAVSGYRRPCRYRPNDPLEIRRRTCGPWPALPGGPRPDSPLWTAPSRTNARVWRGSIEARPVTAKPTTLGSAGQTPPAANESRFLGRQRPSTRCGFDVQVTSICEERSARIDLGRQDRSRRKRIRVGSGPAAFECLLDQGDIEPRQMFLPQKRHGVIVRADEAGRPTEAEARRVKERPEGAACQSFICRPAQYAIG